MSATFEPITGRYMNLELLGRPHRLYVEEAGEGTPLLCLHTAGSDGRRGSAPSCAWAAGAAAAKASSAARRSGFVIGYAG